MAKNIFLPAAFALALAGATAEAQVEGPHESGSMDSMEGRDGSSLRRGLRPVSVIDRSEIELSGARNVWDLISGQLPYNSFGLHRPYVIGSRRTAVLINGRPITDFNIDLDAVPVSAIDRIEILADSDVAIRGPGAAGGVVNIVFRNGFEGVEVVAGGEVPAGAGGDTGHASVLWGGPAGAGHLTIGVDAFQRREIRSADRDYSRSTWTPGGSFADAVNVSVSGNTAFTVGPDGVTAHSLGECTGDGFTGPLSEPFEYDGVGCGFAYGNSGWVWERRERQALFLGYKAPAGGDERVYFETRVSEGTTYAPQNAPPFTVLSYYKPEDCTDSDDPPDC